ncbi:hypothetical protein L3067_14040 [Xanthomonas sp. PPL568]|uniref:LPO_1073/Vpar_1526 family protein n=1 Tax=Xanthomonas indica TaxID=2912242 RepID=UPI001F5A599B|nr:LPO_1073/Vpar_1526 family protein [Xanthomonas indica]MCI2245725.1 hypothetical protein [Xanthomonas indica]
MADPLSLVALGAAVGGAAGKFVEKAWDSGEKWITTYFLDYRPKAAEEAHKNASEFLVHLANRVKQLEESGGVTAEQIENAQEQPDFAVALQKAMLTAAQTSDGETHEILARMLSERMREPPQSVKAMATKMALDIIGYLTPRQLKLLAFIADLMHIGPQQSLAADAFASWFERRMEPYKDLTFSPLDLSHLESLSCLKNLPIVSKDLSLVMNKKNYGVFDLEMMNLPIARHVQDLWQKGIQSVDLTTVGQLVGVFASDSLTGTNTNFGDWA